MSTDRARLRPKEISRFLALALSILAGTNIGLAQSTTGPQSPGDAAKLGDFQVFEFRRYTVKPSEREHFAQYFESYFPEAFQQLGAIAAGSFRCSTSRAFARRLTVCAKPSSIGSARI